MSSQEDGPGRHPGGGAPELVRQLEELRRRAAPLEPDAQGRRRLTGLVTEHVEDFLDGASKAPAWLPDPGAARGLAAFGIPDLPRDPADVLHILSRLVDAPGVATTSPRYLGYIPSGGLPTAAVADLLAATSNRYAGLASVSPGAAALESMVVRWLADVVGFGPGASGVLTSGGTLATLTALVAARDAAGLLAPRGRDRGHEPVVYLADSTHHAADVALRVAGLGHATVRRLPLDGDDRLDVDAARNAVRADAAAGLRPFLLVATAGSTGAGAVDPMTALADLAEAEGLWFHVDAAYGGLFALCPEGRKVLDGLDRADSVVLDPHKTLFLPYGTGAVLVRDGRRLQAAFSMDADYLVPDASGAEPSPADLGPELTRHFRALRVWLPLQLAGRHAFAAALAEKMLLARHAHDLLRQVPGLEVGPEPDLAVVTARCSAGDAATTAVAQLLQESGDVYLTTARVRGQVRLRLAVGSFRTHREDVEFAVQAVATAVRDVSARAHVTLPGHLGRLSPAPSAVAPVRANDFRPGRGEILLDVTTGAGPGDVLECELTVLGDRYGDGPEDLEEAYGAYTDATVWIAARDRSGVLGWVRLIRPGPLPQKTLADLAKAPWSADAFALAAAVGLDPSTTWDLTTIGVRRELGGAGSRVAAALYHGILSTAAANDAEWFAAMLDVRVRMLLDRLGFFLHVMPGTGPRPYMGSPALAPVYAHIDTLKRVQKVTHPSAYRQITLGQLPGLITPSPAELVLPKPRIVDLRELPVAPR